MNIKQIKTQEELEEHLKNGSHTPVELVGFIGQFKGDSYCILTENSRGVFWDNSSGVFWDNSSGVFRGNSSGVLVGNSSGVFVGNSRGEFRDNSSGVFVDNSRGEFRDNSSGVFWDNSSGVFWDNSSGMLWNNSSGVFWNNSSGVFWGNSSGVFWGNSSGSLYDFSHAQVLSDKTKIEQISPKATLTVVDYPNNVKDWAELKGIKPDTEGYFLLWKTVTKEGFDFRTGTINYLSDKNIIAPDWVADNKIECGNGLHLADSPSSAMLFLPNRDTEFKLLQVRAHIDDLVVFGGNPRYPMKCRARACMFVREVDPNSL